MADIKTSIYTHIHTDRQLGVTGLPTMHLFGLGENPGRHSESMQTPHGKALGRNRSRDILTVMLRTIVIPILAGFWVFFSQMIQFDITHDMTMLLNENDE